jgi:uncharacterized membrane protein
MILSGQRSNSEVLLRRRIGMTVGPIEYMVLSCGDNGLGASVVEELKKVTNDGRIRILDCALITKDNDGDVALAEYDVATGIEELAALDGEIGGLISQEDAEYVGQAIEPGSSAVLLVWEDPWAQSLFEALQQSGIALIEGGRVPDDIAMAAMEVLAAL